MGNISQVKKGDTVRLSASTWNAFIDAANANQVTTGGGPRSDGAENVLIRCKNDSGETIKRYEPVAVQGLAIDPTEHLAAFKHIPGFVVKLPVEEDRGKIGISYDAILSQGFGRVTFAGVTPVQVDIVTVDDDIAVSHPSNPRILIGHTQGAVGARILAREKPELLGIRWALVNLGEYRSRFAEIYLGKLAGAITAGTETATVDNLTAMNGESLSDTSLAANNRFSWTAADDADCLIAWNESGSQWELIQVEC